MKTDISYKGIWTLSFPIILSLLAQNIIGLIDTAILGRVGEVALGASAIGGLLYVAILMLGIGIAAGAQILISRRNGEGDFRGIGKITNQSLMLVFIVAVVLFVLVKFTAAPMLGTFLKSKDVLDASVTFLDYRIWGIFFAFASAVIRSFYIGITKTNILTWNAIFMAVVNTFLAWVLVFGELGFPQMGIAGAALASVITEIAAAAYFLIYTWIVIDLKKYALFSSFRMNRKVIMSVMNLSLPLMLQYFMSLGGWFVFFMIVEGMGQHELAISNIIRSIYILLMIPGWGFTFTTNTLVSNVLGEGRPDLVKTIVKRLSILSMLSTLVLVTASFIFPGAIVSVYTNDAKLVQDSIPVLFVILGALQLFSVSFILFSAVSGTGNTKITMVFELITITLYLVGAFFLSQKLHVNIASVWTVEYLYFGLIGILSYFYLRYGKWRGKTI
ncbi:MAG: MATE family efflux transporter [Bacteroidota bacterium]